MYRKHTTLSYSPRESKRDTRMQNNQMSRRRAQNLFSSTNSYTKKKKRLFDHQDMALSLLVLWVLMGLMAIDARGPIQDAINSGAADAYDKDNCTWRRGNDRDSCPDPGVHLYLYTPGNPKRKLDPNHVSDWLRQDYEPTKENIILIHGYAGMSICFI